MVFWFVRIEKRIRRGGAIIVEQMKSNELPKAILTINTEVKGSQPDRKARLTSVMD